MISVCFDAEGRRLGRTNSGSEVDPLTYEAGSIKEKFFSDETLSVLVRVLVTRYLPLTPTELESWSDDPEDFGNFKYPDGHQLHFFVFIVYLLGFVFFSTEVGRVRRDLEVQSPGTAEIK